VHISLRSAAATAAFVFAMPLSPVAAQQGAPTNPPKFDRTGVGDTSIFAPLIFGSPNSFRSGSGAPGSRYWQNRADYDLHAMLDTATKSVSGEMTLRYTNHSPDTLAFIWLQTEQNAFRANSLNSYIFPQNSRFGARDFAGGYTFSRIEQVISSGGKTRRVKPKVRENETMTKLDFVEPLAPGKTATIEIAYRFPVPEHGADRMGRDGSLYEIAQWYPRAAVYDDIRGWNIEPYLGQGEFYLDYGDYNLSVTVPAGYIVAATGALENAKEILPAAQIARLAEASKGEKVINIITADEVKNGAARPKSASGTFTWKFKAKNVRDAVWAASPDYQWDASSYKGSYAFAYYRASAADLWKDAADMSRMSIQEYSERWFQYPWPHISAVEGPISGMEYPMVAMETHSRTKYDLYNVVTHEIGHMWFPMIVGSNERAFMWQDEGFNTFINYFSEARRYPEQGDLFKRAQNDRLGAVEGAMRAGVDKPILVGPDRINPQLLGLAAYVKPAAGLELLREEILGPETFDDAFRTYVARWAFKHPTPADFFRTMEDVSGRRLDWFWREWFVENPHFDQTLDTVVVQKSGDTTIVNVAYANRARGVLPIRARFTLSDGSKVDYNYPAEVWSTNTTRYVRQYKFAGKTPVKIELDPDKRLIDSDRSNNTWTAPTTVVP
jgi:hypothetical protein